MAFDAPTGALRWVVISGPDMASLNRSRQPLLRQPLSVVKEQTCVAPEGLYLQDGWLCFGSRAMEQVKRVNPASGAIEVVASVLCDLSSLYMKIAVIDGTFGPRSSVAVATWSVVHYGYP